MPQVEPNQRVNPLDALANIGKIFVQNDPPRGDLPPPEAGTPPSKPSPLLADDRTPPATEAPESDLEPAPKPKGGKRPGSGRKRKGVGGNIGSPPAIIGTVGTKQAQEKDAPPTSPIVNVEDMLFPVVDAATVEESVATNGPALVNDAYKRAARAGKTGDQFDRIVYLSLLGKTLPQARKDGAKPPDQGNAKATLAALDRILADMDEEETEYTERGSSTKREGEGE